MSELVREHRALIGVVALYVLAFQAYGRETESRLTSAYGLTIVALGLIVTLIQKNTPLSHNVLWGLGIWGLLHSAGGIIQIGDAVLYNVSWGIPVVRFDRLVHAFGFGTATIACWQVLRQRVHIERVTPAVSSVVGLAGMGVGAVNEVVEFAASRLAETNVGGYLNTGWDMVFNTIGCTAAAIWVHRRHRRETVTPRR